MSTTVVSWNIARRREPWSQLAAMDADVALLQEASLPPDDVAAKVDTGPREHWDSPWYRGGVDPSVDRWPMVVRLSDRVEVEWFRQVGPISETEDDEIAVSGIGTIAAARVIPRNASPFIVASMYARWIKPHSSTGRRWAQFSDGSTHRIISDLSAFIGSDDPATHRIVAAGDLNLIHGATASQSTVHPLRDRTVLQRMDALGLEFLGPHYPAGRRANPAPPGLPADTLNVPTFHHSLESPATASLQLDYAFASRGFHERVKVSALNAAEDWGSSDHCRLLIEIGEV